MSLTIVVNYNGCGFDDARWFWIKLMVDSETQYVGVDWSSRVICLYIFSFDSVSIFSFDSDRARRLVMVILCFLAAEM